MQVASRFRPDHEPVFELSLSNADKGMLSVEEAVQRISQFSGRATVLVTNGLPTFVSKAQVLPDTVFVIGFDTAVRLMLEKYYGGSHQSMVNALRNIHEQHCTFLVAGRVDPVAKRFVEANELQIPNGVPPTLFDYISQSAFRFDINSTEIRAAKGKL